MRSGGDHCERDVVGDLGETGQVGDRAESLAAHQVGKPEVERGDRQAVPRRATESAGQALQHRRPTE